MLKISPYHLRRENNEMDELYSIMRDLLEVEYNQKALLYVLRTIETAYSSEREEDAKSIANSTKYYLKALQGELKAAINRMDSYIAENTKKQLYNGQRH